MKNKIFGFLTVLTLTLTALPLQAHAKGAVIGAESFPLGIVIEKVFEEIPGVKPDPTQVEFEVFANTEMSNFAESKINIDPETHEMSEEICYKSLFEGVMPETSKPEFYKKGDLLFTFTMDSNSLKTIVLGHSSGGGVLYPVAEMEKPINERLWYQDIDLIIREKSTSPCYEIDRKDHNLVIKVDMSNSETGRLDECTEVFWDGVKVNFANNKTENIVIENKAEPKEEAKEEPKEEPKREEPKEEPKREEPVTTKEDIAKGIPTGVQTSTLPLVIAGVIVVFGAVFGGYKVYIKKKK